MPTRTLRHRFRTLALEGTFLAIMGAAALTPLTSRAAVISQTIDFDSIQPFGTFTNGQFTLGGWNIPFPVNGIDAIDRFYVEFTSTDEDYLAQLGPLGGVPWVEFSYRDDADARLAFASMGLNAHTVSFGAENPGHFAAFKSLLADGALVVTLGGYESFPDHIDDFTFAGLSQLTVSFELPDGTDPGPGGTIPEPSVAWLAMMGVAAATTVRRRSATVVHA